MAREQNIGPADGYFTGEDKQLPITIFQGTSTTVRQDTTGWNANWMVKRDKLDADEDAVVSKAVTWTNAAQGEGLVAPSVTDIELISGGETLYHEAKRTDPGFKTVLVYGTLRLGQAVHE
jgi:hypothetical protein